MNRLAKSIAKLIQDRMARYLEGEEIRLIFHGPPTEILEGVFEELAGSDFQVQRLLVVQGLPSGDANPPIGESGRCDHNHLLDLRNSPSRPAFLALVEPGLHSIRSITSTSDEFGISQEGNGASVRFEDWWEDAFVQELVKTGLSAAGIQGDDLQNSLELAKLAANAFDDMDRDRSRRSNAWYFLSRLHSITDGPGSLSVPARVAMACGVPHSDDGMLSARDQGSVIGKISDAMADGFGAGIRNAQAGASINDAASLDDFLCHLMSSCDVPTTFERATRYFYSPSKALQLDEPPEWWRQLTTKKWLELLAEDSPEQADIKFHCSNILLELPRGMPVLVEGNVEFTFDSPEPEFHGVKVDLARSRASIGSLEMGPKLVVYEDEQIPEHASPIRYVASADGFKPSAIRLISLEKWKPGILVACRQSRKMSYPKKPRGKGKNQPDFESTLTLPGKGQYELLVFSPSNVSVNEVAFVMSEDSFGSGSGSVEKEELPVDKGGALKHFIQLEVEASCQVEIQFERMDIQGTASIETVRVYLTVEDVPEKGCRGMLERLIILNRRMVESSEKPVIQINRNELSTTLQDWIISKETVHESFQPIVLANDYEKSWTHKEWGKGKGPVFSLGNFLHDPRPDFDEFDPPAEFLESRRRIAERVRGKDLNGLFESAELGEWYDRDPVFATAVESYIESYAAWLSASPELACWVDVALVCSLGQDEDTISPTPDAVLLSPLHPARVGWHVLAQRVLREADESGKPCPAVSVLDPDCVPDLLTLFLNLPAGLKKVQFLSVENSTDYWSVLWNGDRLQQLPQRSAIAPFGNNFGIRVGGISASFTAGQVMRALDDISGLLSAKPRISLVVDGSDGNSDSCNEGIVSWGNSRLGKGRDRKRLAPAGLRTLDVFDHRSARQRPDDAIIANISEDTGNRVRWFDKQPANMTPDLGVIAQLDIAEPSAIEVKERSPLGFGGLLRHRIRRQLPAAFMSETRQCKPAEAFEDAFANKVAACISSLESQGDTRTGISFAPNVHAIERMLERRDAQFVATSSSAVDPAAFLGGWLKEAYLWDYDLPSYSRRSGDTNGYYLLSKVKMADLDALGRAISRLPNCDGMGRELVREMLHEIARRGIPTVRGMSGEDTGSTGDLGVFVAARLLQDNFRPKGGFEGLVPVLEGEGEEDASLCLIVPVDPFQGFLDDLAKSMVGKSKDASLSRPDLLSIGVRIQGEDVRIHLTAIEVKCYPDSTFPHGSIGPALKQAKNLSRLLSGMLPHDGQPIAWALGFQHLLLSIVNFGMRVYSQNQGLWDREALWTRLHEKICSAILSPQNCISVDARGRLVFVDNCARSGVKDEDGDGFYETINISSSDAGKIVSGDPEELFGQVRAKIGRWDLLPEIDKPSGNATAMQGDGPLVVDTIDEPEPQPDHESASNDESDNEVETISSAKNGTVEISEVTSSTGEVKEEVGVKPTTAQGESTESNGVRLAVGRTINSFQPRQLSLNISDTKLNQLNMGVVGDLGTGKTQLLKSLIYQIASSGPDNRGTPPRFLIFDYKRDYSDPKFVEATGAKVVKPHRLPLNLFDTSGIGESLSPWLDRFRFFTDVLDKIYSGIGPVQRGKLKVAVQTAYQSCLPGQQPTLYDVHSAYTTILDGKSDSPMAIIDDLVDMEVFARNQAETVPFDEFLDGVVVVSLDAFGQDDRSKNMLVAVMLNMFYENMLKTEKKPFEGTDPQLRAIDTFLLVDEADNIMKYEFAVLRNLLLQGREFGTGIILASQYLRHFKVNATDYREPLLTWFVHKVPNITPNELSALGLSTNNAEAAIQVKSLEVHEFLYKSHDVSGEVIRGNPFFEIMEQLKNSG